MDEFDCDINELELLAELKAIQCFTSAKTSVEIKIDNTIDGCKLH